MRVSGIEFGVKGILWVGGMNIGSSVDMKVGSVDIVNVVAMWVDGRGNVEDMWVGGMDLRGKVDVRVSVVDFGDNIIWR